METSRILPLKDHIGRLGWFDHKVQWQDIKNGPFLAAVETFGYCLASGFGMFQMPVISSTLKDKRG